MSSSMATGPEDSPPASYSLQDNGNLFPWQRAGKESQGIWQTWIRPGIKHLLGPVHKLNQHTAHPPLLGPERVLQQQRGYKVSAARNPCEWL